MSENYTPAERRGAVKALREAAGRAYPMMHLTEYHVKALPQAELLDMAQRIENEESR